MSVMGNFPHELSGFGEEKGGGGGGGYEALGKFRGHKTLIYPTFTFPKQDYVISMMSENPSLLTSEYAFVKLGIYCTAHQPISTVILHKILPSVCVSICIFPYHH
jgi:hypothetical protein